MRWLRLYKVGGQRTASNLTAANPPTCFPIAVTKIGRDCCSTWKKKKKTSAVEEVDPSVPAAKQISVEWVATVVSDLNRIFKFQRKTKKKKKSTKGFLEQG